MKAILEKKKTKRVTGEEFDRMFDEGADISAYIDWKKATRPGLQPDRVNVDLPRWTIDALDREAERVGVSRQAIIKTWLVQRLDALKAK
ncbi:MAG: hypothetical protein V1746_02520 [bacterium]